MLKFVTDRLPGEPCLLEGNAHLPLQIKSLDGLVLKVLAPEKPWTHERLVALPMDVLIGEEALQRGVDAFLGAEWVGSTEV